MFFYLVVFGVIFLLTCVEETIREGQRKYVAMLMLILLGTVTGLRSLGGSDMDVYSMAYETMPPVFEFLSYPTYYQSQCFDFEMGYLIIISLCRTLGLTFNGYLVFESILFYTLLYLGLKEYTRHWGIVMLVFLYKMFFYDTFVSMRQPITIVIFFCLLKYIHAHKAFRYFFWTLVAVFIHKGAVLLFPLYFVNRFSVSKKWFAIWLLVFFPTAILAQKGLGAHIDYLMMKINPDKGIGYATMEETLSFFYTLEYYLIAILVLLNFKKINQLPYGQFMIKLFLVMLPFVTIFSGVLILRRELDYFFPFYGILIGYGCDVLPKLKPLIILLTSMVCLYGYTRYLRNFDQGGLIPYKSWLVSNYAAPVSIEKRTTYCI